MDYNEIQQKLRDAMEIVGDTLESCNVTDPDDVYMYGLALNVSDAIIEMADRLEELRRPTLAEGIIARRDDGSYSLNGTDIQNKDCIDVLMDTGNLHPQTSEPVMIWEPCQVSKVESGMLCISRCENKFVIGRDIEGLTARIK